MDENNKVLNQMVILHPIDFGERIASHYMRDQVSSSAGGRYTYRNGKLIDWMPGLLEDYPIDEFWQLLPIW